MQEKLGSSEGAEPGPRRDSAGPEPAPAAGATTRAPAASSGTLVAFTATTFLSALLLFSVQPMFAKMVLPILGGSPSVWAVAMLFFQAALLAGYGYAHVLIRSLPVFTGALVHVALSAAAILALPIGVPTSFGEPPAGDPALWQLGLFAVGVGLPFLAVSANAPLLQAWFSASGHAHARDPYFLYAASNLGSLLALLSYPLLLEPALGVTALARVWTAGFIALVVCLAASAWLLPRSTITAVPDPASVVAASPSPGLARRLGWIGLAFVPSALLTAFTTHITMDVASAPLLWVLPLAIYLLTFVLVFRDRPIALVPAALLVGLGAAVLIPFISQRLLGLPLGRTAQWAVAALAFLAYIVVQRFVTRTPSMQGLRSVHLGVLVLAMLALSQTEHEGWFVTASTGVAVFFAATMVAHRTLYESRPAADRLTEFYLLMSLGGVLGGVFAALVAPRIFSQIFEYPILLALTVACRPGALSISFSKNRRDQLLTLWLVVAACVLLVIWLPWLVGHAPAADPAAVPPSAWWIRGVLDIYNTARISAVEWGATAVLALIFGALLLAMRRHPTRQLALALAMCATVVLLPSGVRRSDAERSYFGVYRVYPSGQYNILTHGTTLHGAQKMRNEFGEAAPDATPGTYYYPDSPMARAVVTVRENVTAQGGTKRFGVVGLGSGSLACLADEGERWTFFEIDPLMVRISSDPKNFTYLESCQPNPPDIVLGDARLTLGREPDAAFDLILVDAFTSDAVPIHLMTAEAIKLYLSKVGPSGILVLHISNRYLDLDSVLGATVNVVPGAHGLIITDEEADGSYSQTSSTIAVFANATEPLEPFRQLKGLRDLDGKGMHPWTDDYSDIIRPFLSRMRD